MGASDPRWQLIAESIPHIVWMASQDGTVEYFNRRGTDYTGRAAGETYGWNWVSLVHPEDRQLAVDAWKEAAVTGTPFELEYRLRRADGRYRWQVGRGLPVRDDDGAVVKWIGTLTDIDEAKRHVEELAAAERHSAEALGLLETALRGAPVAFGFFDRDGRFARVNDEVAAICGVPADELVGRNPAEVVPWLWDQCISAFEHVLTTGEPIRNVPLVGASAGRGGAVREWLSGFYPVRIADELSGVGIVGVDVTERMLGERIETAVLSQITDSVYTEDADGRLTSLNRAGARMLGWTEAELRGRRTHDIVHYQTGEGAPVSLSDCPVRIASRSGRIKRAIGEVFTRKDGSVFPVAVTAVPLRIGGVWEGTVVIFRDVSPATTADRTIRVLVASADERVVHAFGAMLDADDDIAVVAVTATPADAVAGAQAHRPHVALVDYDLADLDGIETVHLLRRAAPEVKAILLVAEADEDVMLAAVEAGCNGVLEKAAAWGQLAAAVRAAHHGGAVMSQTELQGVVSSARRHTTSNRSAITLTPREQDVLVCISDGLTNKQVAERLGLTVNTVRNHVQRILYKLDAHSKLEAVVFARQADITRRH